MVKKYGWFVGLILLVVLFIGTIVWTKTLPGKLDGFAQCLTDAGAKFYGAFWCPHCQSQKAIFGNSQKKLPYIECSTPDRKNQTQVCIDAKVEGYPLWIFKDGTRKSGELTLKELAETTSCELPK